MWIVTGYSNKRDGLLFVADCQTLHQALQKLQTRMSGYKVVERHGRLLLIRENEQLPEDLDQPGWAGWRLHFGSADPDSFIPEAVCW